MLKEFEFFDPYFDKHPEKRPGSGYDGAMMVSNQQQMQNVQPQQSMEQSIEAVLTKMGVGQKSKTDELKDLAVVMGTLASAFKQPDSKFEVLFMTKAVDQLFDGGGKNKLMEKIVDKAVDNMLNPKSDVEDPSIRKWELIAGAVTEGLGALSQSGITDRLFGGGQGEPQQQQMVYQDQGQYQGDGMAVQQNPGNQVNQGIDNARAISGKIIKLGEMVEKGEYPYKKIEWGLGLNPSGLLYKQYGKFIEMLKSYSAVGYEGTKAEAIKLYPDMVRVLQSSGNQKDLVLLDSLERAKNVILSAEGKVWIETVFKFVRQKAGIPEPRVQSVKEKPKVAKEVVEEPRMEMRIIKKKIKREEPKVEESKDDEIEFVSG